MICSLVTLSFSKLRNQPYSSKYLKLAVPFLISLVLALPLISIICLSIELFESPLNITYPV